MKRKYLVVLAASIGIILGIHINTYASELSGINNEINNSSRDENNLEDEMPIDLEDEEGVQTQEVTLTKTDDGTWYTVNGIVDENVTGVRQVNETLYYFNDGKLNTTIDTVVTYEGAQYYIVDGVEATDFSGVVRYQDDRWNVVNGKLTTVYVSDKEKPVCIGSDESVVLIGDSYSAGDYAGDEIPIGWQYSWAGQIIKDYNLKNYYAQSYASDVNPDGTSDSGKITLSSGAGFINYGEGGKRFIDLINNAGNNTNNVKVKYVVIMGGWNDYHTIQENPENATNVYNEGLAAIKRTKVLFPNAKVLLGMPSYYRNSSDEAYTIVNNSILPIYKELAEKTGLIYMSGIEDILRNGDAKYTIINDGLHPSVYGDYLLAKKVESYIEANPNDIDTTNPRQIPDGVIEVDGVWGYYKNGYLYPGPTVQENQNGWWYIDENGYVDFNFTGIAKNQNGTWFLRNGKVSFNDNGIISVGNNSWYVIGSEVQTETTDVVNTNGAWWNIVNGKVTGGPTVSRNSNGWWYIDPSGRVDFNYTGLATNSNGTWYCKDGLVDFSITDVLYYQGYWYNIVGNKVCKDVTVAHNSNGWWYINQNGVVDFGYNGYAKNENGIWYLENGKVTFNRNALQKYTGIEVEDRYASRTGTTVYVHDSKVMFGSTDIVKIGNTWYNIVDGQPSNGPTVAHNSNGWFYINENGTVDFNYNGFADNQYGTWYCKNGKVDFSVTSIVECNGKWYNIIRNSPVKGITVAENENGWWYINEEGVVDFSYNGYAKNENGTWYLENGKVTFNRSAIQNYTGIQKDENYGSYIGKQVYIKGSRVMFATTDVVEIDGAWYNIVNGIFTKGPYIASNGNGIWYINENGKVGFDVTDVKEVGNYWYNLVGSKVIPNTVAENGNGWWYINGYGVVDFSYNGLASNQNGTWLIENGKVNFDYTNLYTDPANGLRCVIRGGKFISYATERHGIDVSQWQGVIDWSTVKNYIDFAIIRCNHHSGNSAAGGDKYFYQNIQNAKANHIQVGIYYYSTATDVNGAIAEANYAISCARSAGGIDFPIYIDMEASNQDALSTSQRNAIAQAFINTVRAAGFRAGLYSNRYRLQKNFDLTSLQNTEIWAAEYASNLKLNYPVNMWQYTSSGSIPGINGRVDLDVSYY